MTHRDNHGHDFMGKSDRCTICEGMKPVPDGEYLHPHTKETNEAPVESVSQPKAVDGYLKEFDTHMTREWKKHTDKFPEAENTQFESGFDVAQEIAEKFLQSSIERARREGIRSWIVKELDQELDWRVREHLEDSLKEVK